MSLKDQLKEDMKAAMKAREEGKIALSVIRMVNSAIKNTEINDKIELDDNGVLGILAKEMKTRQDSLTEFEKAGREDLISHVKEEIAVLQKYMPAQMTEDERLIDKYHRAYEIHADGLRKNKRANNV